jgi:hypothetical protein
VFSEIVKLIPSVDKTALNRMFTSLNQRFTSVAKKFGQGMKNAMKLGGLVALGSALIAKLINPLEKAEEIIKRITSKGDDAVTNAEEFGTTEGKLLRLEALGAAKGLDSDQMRVLLGKFQGELAKEQLAARNEKALTPEQRAELKAKGQEPVPGVLRDFIDIPDMADAFFAFVQSLSATGRTDKAKQTVVESTVFGEKLSGKAAEFFNATDFEDVLKKLPRVEVLTEAAKKAGALADLNDLLTAVRNAEDFVGKSKLVNEKQIKDLDRAARGEMRSEDQTLARFDALKSTSIAIQELTEKFDQFSTMLIKDAAPMVLESIRGLSALAETLKPIVSDAKDLMSEGFGRLADGLASLSNKIDTMWESFKASRLWRWGGKLFGGDD